MTAKGAKQCNKSATLCWSCQRACGGCPWTARDPKTHAVLFRPVEGWKAKKTTIRGASSRRQGRGVPGRTAYYYDMDSYHVKECPLYVPDERTKAKSALPEWAARAGNEKGG